MGEAWWGQRPVVGARSCGRSGQARGREREADGPPEPASALTRCRCCFREVEVGLTQVPSL